MRRQTYRAQQQSMVAFLPLPCLVTEARVCVALSMRHRLDVIPTNTDSLGGLRQRDELPVYTLQEHRGTLHLYLDIL